MGLTSDKLNFGSLFSFGVQKNLDAKIEPTGLLNV